MTRREVLAVGASFVATGLLRSSASFAAKAGASDSRDVLIDAALGCVKSGELCQQHCLELLSHGDKSMADCAKSVAEMLTLCRAVAELSAQKSERLSKVAAVCADVCKACEKNCRVHEAHHPVCKNCAESCARCAAECSKVAA